MISLIACALAFAAAYVAGRRSLLAGMLTVIATGYVYGIVRANLMQTFAHFIFDAAVVGLFVTQLRAPLTPEQRARIRPLLPWVALLIFWPFLLMAVPTQDPLVRLVGLRGNVFFLPFLLLGARLERNELYKLGLGLAALNVMALVVGIAEFFLGIERFIPASALTDIVYRSDDAAGVNGTAHRIPATFANAANYAGTMVVSLPFLVGAWLQRSRRGWHPKLLAAGLMAAVLGVFLGASRSQFIVMLALLMVATFSGQLGAAARFAWVGMLAAVGYLVSGEERLQRFMTLQNIDFVLERITWSVNDNFSELAVRYPMGNGLGGGGTSLPYFLQHLIRLPLVNGVPVVMENEYARILLELGLPGLILWISFACWVFTRGTIHKRDPWYLARRLVWVMLVIYFSSAVLGIGLLTAIPQSVLMLLGMGWISARQPASPPARSRVVHSLPTAQPVGVSANG